MSPDLGLDSSFARLILAYKVLGIGHPKIESLFKSMHYLFQRQVERIFSHGGVFLCDEIRSGCQINILVFLKCNSI